MRKHVSRLHLGGNISVFVFVITAIQPFLDVISYFCVGLHVDGFTLLLRGAVLAAITTAGYAREENKRIYYVTAATLALHGALHFSVAAFTSPTSASALISDASNLIRIYSFPITTISLSSLMKSDSLAVRGGERGAHFALFIIVAVEILAVLTNTDPHSYPNKAIGILGWFYFANSQSAILSMLYPISLLSASRCRRRGAFAVTLFAGGGALYFLATRLAYFALAFTLAAYSFLYLYLWKKRGASHKGAAILLTAAFVLSVAAVPFSPMAENMRLVGENAAKKQEHIDSLARSGGTRAVYEYYLPTLVSRFGYERTESLYEGSTDASDICDVRKMKISYCRLLTEDRPISAIAGHAIGEMTHNGKNHDVENDLHGIFFLTGIVGLTLLLAFFIFFVRRLMRFILKERGNVVLPQNAAYACSLLFGLMHAYFTAGVLRRPNAGFFLALTLALIYSVTNQSKPKGTVQDEQRNR